MNKVDLSKYNNDWYKPGASLFKRFLWYYTNRLFFQSYWLPSSSLKVLLLKMFGAKVGKGCNIKPGVNIKYPWKLTIGNHCWIGEEVWIDNLAEVSIEDHVCLSQGAFLLCGNHDFKKMSFDLIVKPIHLENGSWVGAKSIVAPGVRMHSHSILTAGSVLTANTDEYSIYQGNPAVKVKERIIES
ncbi:MAG: colanic acid biosynthesis acetyltransferase WcaF [Flavobacteriales bacterium]|nr:colanic acid biosynthesis acetyltransferase WcaF [Flavobacteriales bacterium]|tara:strand:+ start:356 stop:910 length:555 start_codon:yes stop_codon:yes gene_type:complete